MAESEERGLTSSPGAQLGQYRQAFFDMPAGRRMGFLSAAALVVGGFIALMFWVNQPDYQMLYSGLNQQDASAVVEKLKEMKVSYQLAGDGTTIKVPQESLYEARLALASAGLPKGSGIGYEVFNEVKIGTTDFVQKINYQRALEGELARTIASFSEVESARVHIVMPRESLFVEDEKKPSASVVLTLTRGRALGKSQIQGIVYLVSSAVPDLSPDMVTVVDTGGHLLYRKPAATGDFPAALTASQLDYQRSVEGSLKGKVESMLEQVLGSGRAVVRVSADIDFTRTNTTQQTFDPDQVAVRSETRSQEENQNAGPMPEGSPDQRYNLATRNAAPELVGEEGKSKSNRQNETTNFEVSNTVKQSLTALGGLKRITVAVMVDGPYDETTAEDGAVTRTFKSRAPEEMRQLTDIVKKAVGYNETRGDEISVVNVPFAPVGDVGVAATTDWRTYLDEYGSTVLNIVLGILFFLFVARPLIRYLTRPKAVEERVSVAAMPAGPAMPVGPGAELPSGEEQEMAPEALEALAGPRKVGTRDMILALAQQDPEKTTSVLRAWIREGGGV